ncbi:MAG: ASKHA domain-containing protein [candidate division KSB1 bacterium]|jgi:uncharacterized 2Fe-2S/4Fe-4S cluster protein (DUF4445 family)|nr:ASKHA domain-containing protein [candidate division KSB1 bacterium]
MPRVLFKPAEIAVQVSPGTELLEAARQAKVPVDSPCGGKGSCGKCILRITQGDVDSDSLGLLSASAVENGYVLACKTRVGDTDVTVHVPAQVRETDGQFVDDMDDIFLENRELLPAEHSCEPLVEKHCLQVAPPTLDDGLSDMDRLARAIQHSASITDARTSLSFVSKVADAIRADSGKVTATLMRSKSGCEGVNIESGDTTRDHYGIAVDVGTTTIAVQLVNLAERKIMAIRTAYNDQLHCGLDIIGRINYSGKREGLTELRRRVLKTINELIRNACESVQVDPLNILNASVAGNTTMIHLLLGLKPEYIRLEPYTATILDAPLLRADEIGLTIYPDTRVFISPAVGSYVGGDITAGLLCTEIATGSSEVILYLDIGTNGELVVGNDEFLLTCACSAGPAFEGGGIGCGMRAAAGAIESVSIDQMTGISAYRTIGDIDPAGICGSGMISLIAGLFRSGWLDAAGKLTREKSSPAIEFKGRRAQFTIVDGHSSSNGEPLQISELDIENIIRAKAAIYSASSLLLQQVGLDFSDIGKVYIAGGFGRFLNLDDAITIGLLPDLSRDRFQFIGNASLRGAYMTLVSGRCRELVHDLAKRMTYVELNTSPDYMNQYVAAMFIPHTDSDRFPNVGKTANI